ncbi:hypothetical protein [Hydrogenophaga crocea]|uniref:Uncharacterized protein n=1 Tax=Hydrogenophaga crocea TaxID=2716225 RepID=A0A6G8IIA8_9BURK|nr:hypothetical protein [Hydrogenophaga crocea]QIM52829.1 hypothetical protein G9Q37_12070 [Hydrogenophaga crocea]
MARLLRILFISASVIGLLALCIGFIGTTLAEKDATEKREKRAREVETIRAQARTQAVCLVDALSDKGLRILVINKSRLPALVWAEKEQDKASKGYPHCDVVPNSFSETQCYRTTPNRDDAYQIEHLTSLPMFPGLSEARDKCGSLYGPLYENWVETAYWDYVKEQPRYAEMLRKLEEEQAALTSEMRRQLAEDARKRAAEWERAKEPYLR